MDNTPKIVFVFHYSHKDQQLQLSAEKKIPTSALRGMDQYIAAGKQCTFLETGRASLMQVLRACRENDIIFLNDALLFFAFLNVFFRKKAYYLNMSGSTLLRYKTGFKRLAFIIFLRMVTAVICISKTQMQDLEKVGVTREKMRYIKFGVDTDFFDENINFLENFRDRYIISLGRDKGRDFESLFTLASNLPEEAFIIATNRSRIPEGTIVPANVTVRYDLTPLEVRELYRGAKCCVITLKDDTSTEGSDCSGQTVVQETMSAGMPVFCTQREWLNDYFQPFTHYVPLPQGDVPAMTETMRKFLATPEALCAIGMKGKEDTKRELNTKKFADDLYNIFLESYA